MKTFYFTYGTSERFPFQSGWTEVQADTEKEAIEFFNKYHPMIENFINCAFIYSDTEFPKTSMYLTGNRGEWCVERISAQGREIL